VGHYRAGPRRSSSSLSGGGTRRKLVARRRAFSSARRAVLSPAAVKRVGDEPGGSVAGAGDEIKMAEGDGIEPPEALPPHRFSSSIASVRGRPLTSVWMSDSPGVVPQRLLRDPGIRPGCRQATGLANALDHSNLPIANPYLRRSSKGSGRRRHRFPRHQCPIRAQH
jgi:hypothetical protein